jgi:hypothetical protein
VCWRKKKRFKQYSKVRIVKLLRIDDEYDDWKVNQRMPMVGDIGTLIDFQYTQILFFRKIAKYVVESTGPDGIPFWLCDFEAIVIEPITE